MESLLEKFFSLGIDCMSLAVWLGEDRKSFAVVVGSGLASGISMVRRCSLNRSFKRRLVSPMYCKLQRLHWIYLGADHLTLEEGWGGGGGGWFLVSKIFFSSNLVGRIFFPLPNALQDIFFLSSFLCRIFFFLKKVSCLQLQNVVTFTLWLLQ